MWNLSLMVLVIVMPLTIIIFAIIALIRVL